MDRPTDMEGEVVEVVQADRDVAASGYYAWLSSNPTVPNRILAGRADGHSMVQAFARHRIAAQRTREGYVMVADLADALDELRFALQFDAPAGKEWSVSLSEVQALAIYRALTAAPQDAASGEVGHV